MFIGTTFNSIDAKNRLNIPSKYREALGCRCVITRGLDTNLHIYTMDDWEKQAMKLAALPESDTKIRAFVRSFIGLATECELDKQGRILIPASLIDFAKIKKDLVTVGAINKIEVWSKELWKDPDEKVTLNNEEFSEALTKYNY
jgi:MraZ protein